jgi:hypothetical protein
LAWASILVGVVGIAGLAGIIVLDGAGIPHGSGLDALLTAGWLVGGALALVGGGMPRASTRGKIGLALGILAAPLGLVAFGIFASTQI